MNETKSDSFPFVLSSCDNKPTEAIRNHTVTLEALLKEIYGNHKETIRLCREEQKEKFTKIVALKNKMFERGKEIQKECNILKKENQSLKVDLAASRTDVSCKNCDHLRRSFDSLEEAYKRSLSEKDKMIKYLEAQLNGQCHPFKPDSQSVSPNSTVVPNSTSPDNQKSNRLRLKASQKRVVYQGSPEEKPAPVLPSKKSSNSKPLPAAPLMNVPETCFPDTCAVDLARGKKSVESDDETTVVPDTLALFNPWDSDGETDQNLSSIPEELIEKSLVLESPCNKPNKPSSNSTLVGAEPQKSLSPQREVNSARKADLSDKDVSVQSTKGNPVSASPQLLKMEDIGKDAITYKTRQSLLGGCFKSPSKSPLRKKRKSDLSLTNKDVDAEDKTERKETSVLPLKSSSNTRIVERLSFDGKKSRRRSRSKENQEEHGEVDADLTLPPENWGNETLMNDSVNLTEKIAECSSVDDQIWHTAHPPVNPVSPPKNGSLAPSMRMTQFLEENEVPADERNRIDLSTADSEDKMASENLVEIQSCSQTFLSRSYKFGAVKSPAFKEAVEDVIAAEPEYEPSDQTLCDSFDQVPQKEEIGYAYHAVVRKKDERRRLNGYTCRECVEYYQAKGLSDEEIRQQLGDCSRHRAKYEAPQTPEHFWSVGFPDTMECEKRGYFTKDEAEPEPGPPTSRQLRRRRRLQQLKTPPPPPKCEEDKKTKPKTKDDDHIGMTQMLEYLSAESCDED